MPIERIWLQVHDAEVRAKAIDELKQRFRVEYEAMMKMGVVDCINWADWLDKTAEQLKAGGK